MYSLLRGVRVVELALLAPDLVGMHLADLGADVIKVEAPPDGDRLRVIGPRRIGGLNPMHLRWNRGKRSVTLDLKRSEGRRLLGRLAARADVFVDGLRAGAAARLGSAYEDIRVRNPAIVYCSISGAGQSGPYARLATHGVAYDAFAGLAPPAMRADGAPAIPRYTPVGMFAGPLYAAMAVCAALVRARATGVGCHLDIAELDAAVSWQAEHIDAALNGIAGGSPGMEDAVRYQYYRTRDDRVVLFQASERKFWQRFCEAVGRADLFEAAPGALAGDHAAGDEALRAELAVIFRGRSRAEWVQFFIDHDVPGAPVYDVDEISADGHFQARDLVVTQDHPGVGRVRLFGTPVKVAGESFATDPAPAPGAHTDEVLTSVLELSGDEIARLRRAGIV
jgi:crotonobetainyl-CoA:carnitine CoA-transferase CaiB-like acyl-CoA transferase